jgi:hypothetical protein
MAVGGCGAWRLAKGDIIGISPYSSDKQISLSIYPYTITPSVIHTCISATPSFNPGLLYNFRHLLDNVRQGARHPHPTQQIDTSSTKGTHVASSTLATYSRTPTLPTKHQSQWDYSLAVWSLCHSLVKQVDGHRMQVDGEKDRKGMKMTRVS